MVNQIIAEAKKHFTNFSEIAIGDRVSGTYKGVGFSGVVIYTWLDNTASLEGTKIAHIRLIPNCVGEGLPIQQIYGLPARVGRKIAFYHSDLWSDAPKLVFDKEYTVRY